MSLINDALKKARREAARQEALRRGMPLPPPSFLAPRRRQPLWPWVAAGAIGLITLAAAGFWLGRRAAAGDEPVQVSAAAVSTALPAEPVPVARPLAAPPTPSSAIESDPLAVGTAAGSEASASSPPASAAAPQAAVSPPTTPPAPRTEPEVRSPEVAAAEPAAPSPAEPAPARVAPQPRQAVSAPGLPVYVEAADLPGGRLELGGIAWSKSDPHALINGRIVGRGERIETYTVIDIQPRQVELAGERGNFLLRLR